MTRCQTLAPVKSRKSLHEIVARELLLKHGLCKCSVCYKIATERGCFDPKCSNYRRVSCD